MPRIHYPSQTKALLSRFLIQNIIGIFNGLLRFPLKTLKLDLHHACSFQHSYLPGTHWNVHWVHKTLNVAKSFWRHMMRFVKIFHNLAHISLLGFLLLWLTTMTKTTWGGEALFQLIVQHTIPWNSMTFFWWRSQGRELKQSWNLDSTHMHGGYFILSCNS